MNRELSLKNKIKKCFGKDFPKTTRKNWKLLVGVGLIFILAIETAAISKELQNNPVSKVIKEQTEPQREYLREEARKPQTAFETMIFYFRNNLLSSIKTIGLGIAFGIYPIYVLLINGFTISEIAISSGLPGKTLLSMLLPHGVYELTGYVIAISCGLKLGFGSIQTAYKRKFKPLKKAGKEVGKLIPGIILLIILAGIIEAFISPVTAPLLNDLKILWSALSFLLIILWTSGYFTEINEK